MNVFRLFVALNQNLSRRFDSIFSDKIREDGNQYFLQKLLPKALQRNNVVYDAGGGFQPCITAVKKAVLNIELVGVDISGSELDAAPPRTYDRTITADICNFEGEEDADIVVCQALLEHVPNTPGAIKSMASILKPDGRIFIFVPSRNAVFARLNLISPEAIKLKLLHTFFPKKTGHAGFKAYYDHCTPSQIENLAVTNNLENLAYVE